VAVVVVVAVAVSLNTLSGFKDVAKPLISDKFGRKEGIL
jgi:hypothetical protein